MGHLKDLKRLSTKMLRDSRTTVKIRSIRYEQRHFLVHISKKIMMLVPATGDYIFRDSVKMKLKSSPSCSR